MKYFIEHHDGDWDHLIAANEYGGTRITKEIVTPTGIPASRWATYAEGTLVRSITTQEFHAILKEWFSGGAEA